MKSISLAIASLFVSASAFAACPNLSGSFACAYENGSADIMSITQSETAGVTTYVLNGEAIVADGLTLSLPNAPGARNQSVTYSCSDDNKFKYNYTADLYEANALAGTMSADLLLSKDVSGSLIIEDTGAFSLSNGSQYPWASSIICAASAPPQAAVARPRSPGAP